MTQEMMMKFRTMFEEQRNTMILSKAKVSEDFRLDKDDLLDELDMTTTEMEQSMRLRLRHREALFMRKIDEAMARISDGTFGACESCEEDIELKRLEARPTATLCVSCKEDSERNERVHIDGHRHKSMGTKLRLA